MNQRSTIYGICMVLSLLLVRPAGAHLMPTGKGTLNIRGDAVFMVLSLPISAFPQLDRSGDGKVSIDEFNDGRAATVAAIERGIWLDDGFARLAPEHILLAPEEAHQGEGIGDVSILAKFSLSAAGATPTHFTMQLFGHDQPRMIISASQKESGRESSVTLSPDDPEGEFSWM